MPFGRDWFIRNARVSAGIHNKGNVPTAHMGRLDWQRPEQVEVYFARKGVGLFVITMSDGAKRLCVSWIHQDRATQEIIGRALKQPPFKGLKVINDAPAPTIDAEIRDALIRAQEHQMKFTAPTIALDAWEREVAKIGLGLSCLILGESYTTSQPADKLRRFIFEDSVERRDAIGLRGFRGLQPNPPRLTSLLDPDHEHHVFVLRPLDHRAVLIANFFGRYENAIEIDDAGQFGPHTMDAYPEGVAWVIDGKTKHTRGPIPVLQLIREAISARRTKVMERLGFQPRE